MMLDLNGSAQVIAFYFHGQAKGIDGSLMMMVRDIDKFPEMALKRGNFFSFFKDHLGFIIGVAGNYWEG